ncbi:MAG: hypothetical protein HRU15_10715 [Planctomycetes bacterium]|nr:hypothetical protein [Planctomycetota bacterium]
MKQILVSIFIVSFIPFCSVLCAEQVSPADTHEKKDIELVEGRMNTKEEKRAKKDRARRERMKSAKIISLPVADLEKLHAILDVNQNGEVSVVEFKSFAEAQKKLIADKENDYIKKYDIDGDGKMNIDEQVSANIDKIAVNQMKALMRMKEKDAAAFAQYDVDKDGAINGEELEIFAQERLLIVIERIKKNDEKRFAAMDSNVDGALDYRELQTYQVNKKLEQDAKQNEKMNRRGLKEQQTPVEKNKKSEDL